MIKRIIFTFLLLALLILIIQDISALEPEPIITPLPDDTIELNITPWWQTVIELLGQIITNQNSILGILQDIRDKPTNITVEPNITVTPNITLPEKECKWEKFNQVEHNIDFGGSFGCCGFHDVTRTFQLPLGTAYKNATAISGRVVAYCTHADNNCQFKVNGVGCGVVLRNKEDTYGFPQSCLDAMTMGANNLTISIPSNGVGFIYDYYLESEILPANC